jgi:ABC-2 type transport system permease protein
MTGIGPLLRKELLEQRRTMRLLIVAGLFLVCGILSPVIAKYTPEIFGALLPAGQLPIDIPTPTLADAIGQFVKNVGGTLTLAAILLAMGLVSAEKERGTAAFVLTRPAGRGAFIVAKMVAVAVTLGLSMALGGAGAYVYTTWLFTAPPVGGFIAMCVLLWLGQLVIAALTLLGSTLVRSTIAAGAIGFGAYIGLSLLSALPTIGPYTPMGLQGPAISLAMGTEPTELAGPILVNVGLVVGATLLGWLSLRRQEL